MKVLIVSHNCISSTSNMGKTLLSYFRGFPCQEIAQLYIHCEEPTDDTLCQNYYRFTDLDALTSVFCPNVLGRSFGKQDVQPRRISGRTDTGLLGSVYQYGARRTAAVYALRELLWSCCRWENDQLWQWVEDFGPDVVFFASGDYGFTYEIAGKIAEKTGKPLVICCVDDFYLYNRNEKYLLGRLVHRRFMKTVYKTMEKAEAIFVICDSLKQAYEPLFGKHCHVLRTSAPEGGVPVQEAKNTVVYLGNLELGRETQLATIGRTLKSLDVPGVSKYLDVYSLERDPNILNVMTMENGIRFHGAVSAQRVWEILGESMAVIHTESFDPRIQKIVRHSVSTKIPESLMNGPCLIAYGPSGIASMDYLIENGAAFTITSPEQLEQGLREILADAGRRETIVEQARKLAWKNHSIHAVPQQLRAWLEQICGGQ